MDDSNIIVLNNGVEATITPISLEFMAELEKFFRDRGIPREKIPIYLIAFGRAGTVELPKRGRVNL